MDDLNIIIKINICNHNCSYNKVYVLMILYNYISRIVILTYK